MSARDEDRAALIAGLRELADFLEEHPDLPVPAAPHVHCHPRGTDEEERAEVDRAARVLGREAGWTDDQRTHYGVVRHFGSVEFGVVSITAAAMERYSAHMASYHKGDAGTEGGA